MTENNNIKPSQEKVWKKYLPEGAVDVDIARCTAFDYLKASNMNNLGGNAIHYYGTTIKYRELFLNIVKYSDAFDAVGVKEGDLVSAIAVGVPEYLTSIYALNRLGATTNTIDPRMDVDSIKRMVKQSGSRITMILDVMFSKVEPILDELDQDLFLILPTTRSMPLLTRMVMNRRLKLNVPYGGKIVKWTEFLAKGKRDKHVEAAPYQGDRVVAITYTGGTTGFPKGVMITNDSMNAVAENFKNWGLEYNVGDRFLGIIPVFSSYGLVCGLHMPLCMTLELVTIPKFDPLEFGALVKKFRPNHMISTPAFYEMLMDSKEMVNQDLSFLITLGSGGDTMNEGLELKLARFMEEHNIKYPLAQGYGVSELSAAATFCANGINKAGSVGIPSPTTVVGIFDPDTQEELDYNQVGEVCVTGPSMMKGYWNNPAETENVMRKHADGRVWIHSGDLGLIDEDGFLFIKGRIKRMITRFDGHKVFPVNLESMINAFEDVRNCAVIGVKDRGHGQGHYPLVIIELAEGVDADVACRKIFQYCNTHAEERGRPVGVIAIDEIPLTAMGKNDFRALEDLYRTFDYTTLNYDE
ncbi:MAG: acyl--CoA ligase [Candidatus Methanomethylophilaceae archaeon]|nr:acyl--CoA ligase [Candidatus Methanomethylophilaceae archaeon]